MIQTKRVIMTREQTTAWLLRALDWPPSYWLGDVPVHVVDETHWLARHAAEMPADVVVHRGDEEAAWKSMRDYDDLHGRPPSRIVCVRSVVGDHSAL